MEIIVQPLPVPSHVAPVPAGFDAGGRAARRAIRTQRFQSAKELSDALGLALGLTGSTVGDLAHHAVPRPARPAATSPMMPPQAGPYGGSSAELRTAHRRRTPARGRTPRRCRRRPAPWSPRSRRRNRAEGRVSPLPVVAAGVAVVALAAGAAFFVLRSVPSPAAPRRGPPPASRLLLSCRRRRSAPPAIDAPEPPAVRPAKAAASVPAAPPITSASAATEIACGARGEGDAVQTSKPSDHGPPARQPDFGI